ncbi:peptidase m24 methionine aminopeptidase [Lucifera butyrica]|uniref:Peptidase m24 methionine aminopeptidase n=1 Tax=Lucifera butyrica TaxID=1351585 RepID=A0A498RA83_9FIRM|nr:M24 family metallopeptidase [Lucifera butyrica]VBB09606.1 peptidase m24 methionine aminopeptidase [Lucifera butyrica]
MKLSKRIEAVRQRFLDKETDAVLVNSPHNKFYLGGLFSSSGYLLITKANQYMLVDGRYYEEVQQNNKLFQVELLGGPNTLAERLNSVVAAEGLKQIGFEGRELSYDAYRSLQERIRCRFYSLDLAKIRSIKETAEIETIQTACTMADAAFRHILGYIEAGMSEKTVENELVRFLKEQGGQKDAFDSIVASGVRGALPHGKATDKIIQKGELVTLDFGVIYQHYCSDITRTLAVGRCPEELVRVYAAVKAAGEAAMERAKPGLTLGELDSFARNLIRENGYGDYFGHNLGHGLGIQVHEYPAVAPGNAQRLEEGMVITIEPGIYLPQVGGVRIEEDVLITRGGCRPLTRSSRDLIVI